MSTRRNKLFTWLLRQPFYVAALSNFRLILETHQPGRFARSCSQIRRTHQPRCLNVRVTSRSRAVLAANFRSQNTRLFIGMFECLGHPCQKQPSTKIIRRCLRKLKSGLPKRVACRRHPVMPCNRRSFASATSVSLLPRPRMRDITSDRLAFVKTSGMTA